ncbi:MAG: FAD-binding oxidoreductase [Chloroflexi bacterium]|nr:MAG: FAD-binding oxidoreductase [Chloroflexota bacterium]
MTQSRAEVVICGAGIAGVSAAYHLAVRHGVRDVILIDERAPLTLTSDKSTECYRNWWPGPGDAMVSLMNRSIDILEELAHESGNRFHLNRRGYLFATADPDRVRDWEQSARESSKLGAGPVRHHTGQPGEPAYVPAPAQGFEGQPTGADLILDPALIREQFPYLSEDVVAVLHVRRAGWFSAQQLGMYLLEQAREHGVRFLNARVDDVAVRGGRVESVHLSAPDGPAVISTRNFVNAAGPFVNEVARMIGIELPVFSELHLKIAFNDHKRVVPRNAPLLIWSDPTRLPWSDEERAMLAESEETRWLLQEFPPGVHTRPEGGPDSTIILILWTYHIEPTEPVFPFEVDPVYPEVALRGLSTMIPGLATYFDRAPRPVVDGGYYTKTRENRPLIGPLPVEGAYIIGALSGFGQMAGCAAGELLAAHVTGGDLPRYAPAFSLERYEDPEYQQLLETWGDSGQL